MKSNCERAFPALNAELRSHVKWCNDNPNRYDYYKEYAKTPHDYEDLVTFPGRRTYVPIVLLKDALDMYYGIMYEMVYAVTDDYSKTHNMLERIGTIYKYFHEALVTAQIDIANYCPKQKEEDR